MQAQYNKKFFAYGCFVLCTKRNDNRRPEFAKVGKDDLKTKIFLGGHAPRPPPPPAARFAGWGNSFQILFAFAWWTPQLILVYNRSKSPHFEIASDTAALPVH